MWEAWSTILKDFWEWESRDNQVHGEAEKPTALREASGISDPRGMRNWWFIWVAESGSPFLNGIISVGLESRGRTPGTLTASRERCEGGITTTQALWDNHCSRLRWRKPADKRDSQVHRWADWHHERQAWDSANGNESWRNRANGMLF